MADLMLGLTVLPYSSTKEVLRGHWPFGYTWCRIWLAVDVWLCTASILNLCAISLDRYLALTRPFKYRRLMSPRRAKLLVGCVWILSFIVCFPPLVGWNESGTGIALGVDSAGQTEGPSQQVTTASILAVVVMNESLDSTEYAFHVHNETAEAEIERSLCKPMTCDLEAEAGYRIYSAFGSFWVPVWIMVFFYWRIYRTAADATAAFKRGELTTKTGRLKATAEKQVTLRIHRGGGKKYTTEDPNSPSLLKAHRSLSTAPSSPVGSAPPTPSPTELDRQFDQRKRSARTKPQKIKITFSRNGNVHSHSHPRLKRSQSTPTGRTTRPSLSPVLQPNGNSDQSSVHSESSSFVQEEISNTSNKSGHRMGRSHIKTHIKRLNKEKKAAKTVGIIVGCFILCWAPFFTVYLIDAFCNDCTPVLLFTIFFWLGYCNSAVNPCIYALCSRDFRYAFKKLLRCRCERGSPLHQRKNTKLVSLLNSIRIRISRESDSNSDQMENIA
jgi:octopamine receptor